MIVESFFQCNPCQSNRPETEVFGVVFGKSITFTPHGKSQIPLENYASHICLECLQGLQAGFKTNYMDDFIDAALTERAEKGTD